MLPLLVLRHRLVVIANWIFKNHFSRLVILSTLIYAAYFIVGVTGGNIWILIIYSAYLTLIFVPLKRLSNVIIVNLFTGKVGMSVANTKGYWQHSYIKEKDTIARQFQEEFIEGLLAFKSKRTIRFNTHKWLIENVIGDDRITSVFDIEIKKTKPVSIATEILFLVNPKEVRKMGDIIKRKRIGYRVKLTRRTINNGTEKNGQA